MNIFFTFAFNIGRIPDHILIRTLYCLNNSLKYFKNTYKLIVYSNIDSLDIDDTAVEIVRYDISNIPVTYPTSMWLSMSFHKLAIAKEVAVSYNATPIWIDLDTIVCRNIDDLSALDTFFIQQGIPDKRLRDVAEDVYVPIEQHIMGNIWKASIALLDDLVSIWNTLDKKPYYDAQGLFTIAYYLKGFSSRMHILDNTYINGFEICSQTSVEYPDIKKLYDTLYMKDGRIMHTPTNRPVQFMSFTFATLIQFLMNNEFDMFLDPAIVEFFKVCGYC